MMASQVKGGWIDTPTCPRCTVTTTVAGTPPLPFTDTVRGAAAGTNPFEVMRGRAAYRGPSRRTHRDESSLTDLPDAYHRDRGHGLAQFGSALVAANEPEHAASVTREALGIARGCGSGRTMHHIRAVGDSLRPQAKLPAVARLLDKLAVTGK